MPIASQVLLCAYSATAVLKDSHDLFPSIRDITYRSMGHVLNYTLPDDKVSNYFCKQMQNIRVSSTLWLMVLIASFFLPCLLIFKETSIASYNIAHILGLSLVVYFAIAAIFECKPFN